ncbi:hypothetical protein ALC53_00152, partial [Atta colombica]
ARYETSGAVVLGASRSLIAPRVAAKRSLIKFYCAGIKLTGRLAGTMDRRWSRRRPCLRALPGHIRPLTLRPKTHIPRLHAHATTHDY